MTTKSTTIARLAALYVPLKGPNYELHLFTKRHETGTRCLKCPIKVEMFLQGNIEKGRPRDKIFLKLQLREAEPFQNIHPPRDIEGVLHLRTTFC